MFSHSVTSRYFLPRSDAEGDIFDCYVGAGLAIDAMKMHPAHAGLQMKGFQCLRDLDNDTKIAVAHAGKSCYE